MAEPVLADLDERIAKPGDPDLDLHLTGLRIAALVINYDKRMTEVLITFDTSEAAGFWINHSTGERFIPETVTSVDISGGIGMTPGNEWLLSFMVDRLTAWEASGALITVASSPGKEWQLLYSPLHPDGEIVPFPRKPQR
jgi:hypothetical protein